MNIWKRPLALFILSFFMFAQIPTPLLAENITIIMDSIKANEGNPVNEIAERDAFSRILTEEGGILEYSGVRLDIPSGAVEEEITITIEKLDRVSALSSGMSNVTAGADGYRFGPAGYIFRKNIKVTVPFDKSVSKSKAALSNLYTYFYDEQIKRWERLARFSLDEKAGTITSLTNHFTDMINSTLQLPEGPSPIDFNINSIKNLEAADPSSGISQLSGPTAGPFGGASFQIPFRLAPGRGRTMPDLALSYNSDSTNGILGRGFDISIPKITIDTKFGLPDYDGEDTYLLDGEELIFTGTDSVGRIYRQRVEKGFSKIRRITGGNTDYWEVTDKSGTVRTFGRGEGWIGPDRNDQNRTFSWFLTKIKDANGNTVDYTYFYDSVNKYTYPDEITYSGYENGSTTETGKNKVTFIMDYDSRPDRRINARGRFSSKLTGRLERVEISYDGLLFRTYECNYKLNEYEQTVLISFTEKDGAGNEFYKYEFDYHGLPEVTDSGGNVIGYQGFGDAEQVWGEGYGLQAKPINNSVTTSAGGNLYTGVKIFIPIPFIGKKTLAHFGVRAGVNFAKTLSRSQIMDINGDGLPDIAFKDGSVLKGYLNRGSYFDTNTTFDLSGFNVDMNRSSQDSFNLGISAGLFGVSGSLSMQRSWSKAKTLFSDVNGDGFTDLVERGDSTYLLHDGENSFSNTSWQFVDGDIDGAGVLSDVEKDNFNRAYYREDPVRKWRAYKTGTVEVEEDIALVEPGVVSADGVSADLHFKEQAFSAVLDADNFDSARSSSFEINRGENIYFHLNPGEKEQGDKTNWNSAIRYTQISLFEDMEYVAEFYPPASSTGTLPNNDNRFASIYNGSYNYTLKPDWQSNLYEDLLPVYDALVEHGYFVPRRIPKTLFQRIFDASSDLPGPFETPSEKERLAVNYYYHGDEDAYYLHGSINVVIGVFLNHNNVFSLEEKKKIAFYNYSDVHYIYPRGSAGGRYLSYSNSVDEIQPSIFLPEQADLPVGSRVYEKGFLLDVIFSENDPDNPDFSIWLKEAPENRWQLTAEHSQGGDEVLIDDVALTGGENFSFTLDSEGKFEEYSLSTGFNALEQLPDSLYLHEISNYLLEGEVFEDNSIYTLSSEEWTALNADSLTEEEAALILASYEENGGNYTLLAGIDQSDFQDLLFLIDEKTISNDSILSANFNGLAEKWRIVLFDPADMETFKDSFSDEEKALIDSYFDSFTKDDVIYYFQHRDLSSSDLNSLVSFMSRFRRDTEIFPYYHPDGSYYFLKDGLSGQEKLEIAITMQACDLWTINSINHILRYNSSALLPVTRTVLPEGEAEETVFREEEEGVEEGSDCGVVVFMEFDSSGRTIVHYSYIHEFNSNNDFSALDLIEPADLDPDAVEIEDMELADYPVEVFGGGHYGWYYGVWGGYYEWNEENFYDEPSEAADGKTALPPYLIAMSNNLDNEGNRIIENEGRDGKIVSPDAWIGQVSSYAEGELDSEGNSVQTEYSFVAYIHNDTFHPNRKGGDSLLRVPVGDALIAGGAIGSIQKSKSKSTDKSGGVSIAGIGANISSNKGSSFGYIDLLDINGDRYPDLLQFPQDGGTSFDVLPGTGGGFAEKQIYNSSLNYININKNEGYGFGGSLNSSSGALFAIYDSDAEIESMDNNQSGNAAVSGGVNGTLAESWQTVCFRDINGDGLPDHIGRTGTGGFEVFLNTGNNSFTSSSTWSGGMSRELLENKYDTLNGDSIGLSYTNTGSFGANVGAGTSDFGVSGGFTGTVNKTLFALMDMNGDGLPDQVSKRSNEPFFVVRYNLGDRFSDNEVKLYRPEWGVELGNAMSAAITTDLGVINEKLGGLNLFGKGMPSFGSFPAGGNEFGDVINPLSIQDVIDYSCGVGFNLGTNITFDFSWWLLALTITPGLNGSYASTSATMKMMDINGDGLPDHVLKVPGMDTLRVKVNGAGKTGLLKRIGLPAGGSCELDYEKTQNTVSMPQSRYVLSHLTKNDGYEENPDAAGEHSYTDNFSYYNGYYDRAERMFYGFEEVQTTKGDGSVRIDTFDNSDFYTKGLLLSSSRKDGNGNDFIITEKIYNKRTLGTYQYPAKDVVFMYLAEESTTRYDTVNSTFIPTKKTYQYGSYGNIIRMEDFGIESDPDDNLILEIDYADLPGTHYLKAHPEKLNVEDSEGSVLRKREGSYDDRGNLILLRQYSEDSTSADYLLTQDSYGNLISLKDPLGFTLEYQYDDEVSTFVKRIRSYNSELPGPGYTSFIEWDYKLGVETLKIDINGNTSEKSYDNFGRLISVRSPYDTGSLPAVSYEYDLNSFPWKSISHNKISFDPNDIETMKTVVTSDGLGRIIQTAKEGEVYSDGSYMYGWNKSGIVAFDAKGRPELAGQTVFEESSTLPGLSSLLRPTAKEYDILDRITKVTLPDGSVMSIEYVIEGDYLIDRVTDPEGNISETLKDIRGNTVEIRRKNGSGTLLTRSRYEYNMMGEMLNVIDNRNFEVHFSYDLLGRRLTVLSPDAGLIEYHYDEAGNIVRKVDSNLRKVGGSIEYHYDGLGRLIETEYPDMENVLYEYGDSGAPFNRAGRLVHLSDESGSIEYGYGLLGETTTMTKTLNRLTPLENDKSASFEYTFDYLGRMENIVYPDGEELFYEYDSGGQVARVTGSHNGLTSVYVDKIGYDEYGQRNFIRYGNGLETIYSYDENRRWLSEIETENSNGYCYQSIDYSFDRVGNILGLENNAERYNVTQDYEYDDLYQLIRTEGYFEDREFGYLSSTNRYIQHFSFDTIGNIMNKQSENIHNPVLPYAGELNYNLDYEYYAESPHQAEKIGDMWYLYDDNGNMIEERAGGHSVPGQSGIATLTTDGDISIVNYGFGLVRNEEDPGSSVYMRTFTWDEENRLKVTEANSQRVEYIYDADGERTVKYSDLGETLYFNSMWQIIAESPSFRQSKHIYVGETRIATKLNIEGDNLTGYEAVYTYYYHPDHLGSANMVTDYEGGVYEQIEYTPYGEMWVEDLSDSFDKIPFRFTGKEWDEETKLYYYGARYLNPRTSRWISPDPVMDGLNWYGYCENNPIKYDDPTGLAPRNLTDQQREIYKNYTSNLSVADTMYEHDCADLATAIYSMGMLLSTGEWAKHQELTHNGSNISGVSQIQSSDFFPENTNNITFYDDKSFSSPDIEVGTVAVWKSDNPEVWTGHVATVVGLEEEDGMRTGIWIIQGHGGSKETEKVKITSQADLDSYLGTFHGWGEIGENSTGDKND